MLCVTVLNHRGKPLGLFKPYQRAFEGLEEALTAFRDLSPNMAAGLVGVGMGHLESRILHVTLDEGSERIAERHYDFRAHPEFEAIMESLLDLGYVRNLLLEIGEWTRRCGISTLILTEAYADCWHVEFEGYPNRNAYDQARTAMVQPMTEMTREGWRASSFEISKDYACDYDHHISSWHQQYGTLQAAWLMSDLIHRREGLLPFPSLADLARDEGASDEDLALGIGVGTDQARAWLDGSDRPNKEERDGIACLLGTDQLTITRAVFMGRVEAREQKDGAEERGK